MRLAAARASAFLRAVPLSSSSISQTTIAGVIPAIAASTSESPVWPQRRAIRPSAPRRMGTWPGRRNSSKNRVSSPARARFTWSAIALIVVARSLSVIPVKVEAWLTQSENEERFFRVCTDHVVAHADAGRLEHVVGERQADPLGRLVRYGAADQSPAVLAHLPQVRGRHCVRADGKVGLSLAVVEIEEQDEPSIPQRGKRFVNHYASSSSRTSTVTRSLSERPRLAKGLSGDHLDDVLRVVGPARHDDRAPVLADPAGQGRASPKVRASATKPRIGSSRGRRAAS